MIIKLYTYFGVVGIISVLLWISALIMLVNYLYHERRFVFYLRAVVVAVLGYILAVINSHFVSMIEIDRSRELQMEFEQREKEINYLKDRAAKVKYAEDNKYDALDLAGVANKEGLSIYEKAARENGETPLYKKKGKQKREGKDSAEKPDLITAVALSEKNVPGKSSAKQLPLNDFVLANRWDKANLIASKAVIFLALLAVIIDYLSRFNKTFGIFLPLPVSGRLVDHLFPKTHSLVLASVPPELVRDYLTASVRKGETFIYFGSADPFRGQEFLMKLILPLRYIWSEFVRLLRPFSLTKIISGQKATNAAPIPSRRLFPLISFFVSMFSKCIAVIRRIISALKLLIKKIFAFIRKLLRPFQKPLRVFVRFLTALFSSFLQRRSKLKSFFEKTSRGIIELFPVRKLAYSSGMPPFSDSFVFESAWFGRYCFVFTGTEIAHSSLESIRRFLEFRMKPHATAGHTVNIVWDLETRIPERTAEDIVGLCRETNFKFVIVADQALPLEYKNIFDEAFPDHSPTEPKTSFFARFLMAGHPLAIRIRRSILNIRHKMQKKRAAKAEMKKSQAPAIPDKAAVKEQSIVIKPAVASSVHMEPKDIDIGKIKPVLPEKSGPDQAGPKTLPPVFETIIKEAQPGRLAPDSIAKKETMEPAQPAALVTAPPRLVIKKPKVSETVEKGEAPRAKPRIAEPSEARSETSERAKDAILSSIAAPAFAKPAMVGVGRSATEDSPCGKPEGFPWPTHVVSLDGARAQAGRLAKEGEPGTAIPEVHVPKPIIKVSQKTPEPLHPEGRPSVLKEPVSPNRAALNIHMPSLKTEAQNRVPSVKPAPDLKVHEIPPAGPSPKPKLKIKVPVVQQTIEQKQPEKEGKINVTEVDQTSQTFKFFCPDCSQKLSAEFAWQGKSVTCPRCGTKITIPKVF